MYIGHAICLLQIFFKKRSFASLLFPCWGGRKETMLLAHDRFIFSLSLSLYSAWRKKNCRVMLIEDEKLLFDIL